MSRTKARKNATDGAAAPGDRRFSLITVLAEKLLGHLTVPLVVGPGNPSDEQITNMT